MPNSLSGVSVRLGTMSLAIWLRSDSVPLVKMRPMIHIVFVGIWIFVIPAGNVPFQSGAHEQVVTRLAALACAGGVQADVGPCIQHLHQVEAIDIRNMQNNGTWLRLAILFCVLS